MKKTCEVCVLEKDNFLKFSKICDDCIELNQFRCKGECNEVLNISLFKHGRKTCNNCYKKKERNRYIKKNKVKKTKYTVKQLRILIKECNNLEDLENLKNKVLEYTKNIFNFFS